MLGLSEAVTGATSLHKLHLSLSTGAELAAKSHDNAKWLACLLLCAMENQGVRKFAVQRSAGAKSTLKLWVFTPDLTVSSSKMASAEPMRVVKVLWQELEDVDTGPERLSDMTLSEGELRLQRIEVESLLELLKESAALIPEAAREFQEWNVGLLERFVTQNISTP